MAKMKKKKEPKERWTPNHNDYIGEKNDILYCRRFWTSLEEMQSKHKLTEFNWNGEKRPFKPQLEKFILEEVGEINKKKIIEKLPELKEKYLSSKKVFEDNDAWKYIDPSEIIPDGKIERTRKKWPENIWIKESCLRCNIFVLRRKDFTKDIAGKYAFMVYYLILTLVGFKKEVRASQINWTRKGKIANTKTPLFVVEK